MLSVVDNGILKVVVSCLIISVLMISFWLFYHREYNGIWEMSGYGLAFRISNGVTTTYEVTDSYYYKEIKYGGLIVGNTFFSGLGKFNVKKTSTGLEIIDPGAQNTYKFSKMGNDYFKKKTLVKNGMQIEKFHMFYEMFEENYAFEKLYGANLSQAYQELKESVNATISDYELFIYMGKLVKELRDGHITISWKDQVYCPHDYVPEWISDKKQLDLLSGVIIDYYIENYKKFEDCPIRYGLLSDEIGIIVIHGMGIEAFEKSDSTKKAMDQIIREFNEKGIKKIAIELRFNNGGFDETSLCIAGYFSKQAYLAYKKQAYYKGKYTELQEVYVKPQALYFEGEITLLTSGFTISAAETFVQAMLANPQKKVTIVGESTAGFYSDAMNRSLPDGFSYTLSNERYYSFDNEPLEGKSIVPHVIMPISMESIYGGTENALEWLLKLY